MPSPNPTTRREYKGAAAGTTLQNSMTSSDTTFVLVSANNWPTGGVGKFVVTINRGLADEEKILCDTQSSRNVACLLANRGFDGTTAQSHAAGATVECTISAFDADEWNAHTAATTGVHGVAGAVVGTTDTQALTNKTVSGGTLTGTIAASGATLTSPTLTSPTLSAPTVTGATDGPSWSVSNAGLGTFANIAISSPSTGPTATAGVNGAVPATAEGYLSINLGGTVRKIPYFN